MVPDEPKPRTRASVSSLVKEVVGKDSSLGVPTAALQVLLAFRRDQVESNLTLFFEKIARGEEVWSDGRFHEKLQKEVELTDFADLVEAVAREQEREKIEIYANLYCAFVDDEISDDGLRRHMVLAARELTNDEALFLLEVYRRLTRQPRNLTKAIQSIYRDLVKSMEDQASGALMLIRLDRLGLFKEIEGWKKQSEDESGYTLLPLGSHFVRAAFAIHDEVRWPKWE